MRARFLILLAALVLGGCHATAPTPVTHENILTVTPNADATTATQ